MLFSEPKIPQYAVTAQIPRERICFSALQRAENSSIRPLNRVYAVPVWVSVLFSEPKIPQSASAGRAPLETRTSFSALQRAENSSM